MDAHQINLVRTTWAKLVPIADQAADLFYNRLFELDPSVRPLFTGDMKEQGKLLMGMIDSAVQGLDNLDSIVPAVQALGMRHAGYGVESPHYATVASALLWTLEQGLGSDFTEEVKDAWVETYQLLSGVMQQAATDGAAVA